jgi:hypothetical protein
MGKVYQLIHIKNVSGIMNKIGFGFLCFGDEIYFKGTVDKIKNLTHRYPIFVLTEKPEVFQNFNVHTIKYDREKFSYSDKMLLIKHTFEYDLDYLIIIDSDSDIIGYEWLNFIDKYQFKYGITYVDTLRNHVTKKHFINELNLQTNEWYDYYKLANHILPDFDKNELIWEYFLIINKNEFNVNEFFEIYGKLQQIRENIDITMNKNIIGAGEGISLMVSCKKTGIPIQYDDTLSNEIKKYIKPILRRYTPKNKLPKWMTE